MLIVSWQRKVPRCFWIYSSLNWCAYLVNSELVATLLAKASIAQLAEHHTRFVGLQVWFPAGWPKLHFCNRTRLGLKKVEVYRHSTFPSLVFVNLYISYRKYHIVNIKSHKVFFTQPNKLSFCLLVLFFCAYSPWNMPANSCYVNNKTLSSMNVIAS